MVTTLDPISTESAPANSEVSGYKLQLPLPEAVAAHPFVAGMKSEHLRLLCQAAMFKSFCAGEVIFRQGDFANRCYLIQKGKIALEIPNNKSEPMVAQYLGAGDLLGWSWLFPPYAWHFDARAVEPTSAIFFYGTMVRASCDENPEFGCELMQRVSEVAIKRLALTRRGD